MKRLLRFLNSFEGYNVYRYSSANDLVGERVATFDLVNGIQGVRDVIDATLDPPSAEFTAFGSDNGLQHSYALTGQTNYTDTYWGVQAYAYNEHSTPKIVKSICRSAPPSESSRSRGHSSM